MTDVLKNIFISIIMIPIIIFKLIRKGMKKIPGLLYSRNIINYFLIYWIIAFLFYLYGPIKYPKFNIMNVVVLFIIYIFSTKIGSFFGQMINIKKNHTLHFYKYSTWKLLITIGLIIGIILSILTVLTRSSFTSFNQIFNNLLLGLSDPSQGYLKNLSSEYEGGAITQLATVFSPLVHMSFVLALFFWEKLKAAQKWLTVLYIIVEAGQYIIKGTNFGLFKVAIILVTVLLVNKNVRLATYRRKKSFVVRFAPLIIAFVIFYFFFSISSRMSYQAIPTTIFNLPIDQNNFFIKNLPSGLSIPLLLGISYLSQGFYGFQLATTYDFTTTYGFGSGRFLLSFPERLFGLDLWDRTFQNKMDAVWDSRINWHTAFTWIANDISFFGVIVYLLIIGFLFILVFNDVKKNQNPLAVVLLPLYVIMFVFIPLNNVVFDNPLLFMPFITFNFIWMVDKIYFKEISD